MKELSIEEKAKAYDEAIEKAKDMMSYKEVRREDMEYLFPELKESEDERIRKEIINYIKNSTCQVDNETYKSWIAWLEKQGTSAKLSEEEQNRFTKGVLSRCALSFIDYLDAHKYESKMCVSNGECEDIENAFHNTMWDRLHRYYCKYIEKQGEQKSTDKVESKFKKGDVIRRKDGAGLEWTVEKVHNNGYYTLVCADMDDFIQLDDNWELIEQKPTDKVEPKFHEGEWIVFNGLTLHVNEVVQGYYRTTSINGITNSYDWNIDNLARLWTIQEAKDGDVLCTYECDEPKIVFILKGTPKKHYALSYHCFYNIMYPHFDSDSKIGCLALNDEDIKPVTKEQRDLLFQKMKEAGYEW